MNLMVNARLTLKKSQFGDCPKAQVQGIDITFPLSVDRYRLNYCNEENFKLRISLQIGGLLLVQPGDQMRPSKSPQFSYEINLYLFTWHSAKVETVKIH